MLTVFVTRLNLIPKHVKFLLQGEVCLSGLLGNPSSNNSDGRHLK